jgi:hypothetical protein
MEPGKMPKPSQTEYKEEREGAIALSAQHKKPAVHTA